MFFKALAVAAAFGSAVAQRPNTTSICDYYTTALLKTNNATTQYTLLTLLVNTAVIGNYTQPNVGVVVPGILTAGMFNGTAVNLLPYFTGALASTNTGGLMGTSVNFLDGGGAAPLMLNKPAWDNSTSSNQYTLLTHLYEYFGTLLGCSLQGGSDYPAYNGDGSQYNVHKFMDLSYAQVGYFIQQVAYSAASFGVAASDLQIVGNALGALFDFRCSPATIVIPSQPAGLQSICTDPTTCVLATNATCASYTNVTMPSAVSPSGSTASPTTSSPAATSKGAGAVYGVSVAAVFGGIVAAFI